MTGVTMDSLVIQTAIGLVFVFAAFSALVSVLTEATSRLIGLRGEYLMRGMRSLLDGQSTFELPWSDLFRRTSRPPAVKEGEPDQPMVTKVLEEPIIARSADKAALPPNAGNAKLSARERRRLPSYVSSRSFARAFLGVLVPDPSGRTTITAVRDRIGEDLPDGDLKTQLLSLLAEAGDDVTAFRQGLEEWYDDHMARVSGWYKRHVRWISLGLGAFVVVAFNVNVVDIARSLYTDEALRASVVTQATNAAQCRDKEPAACLSDLRKEIEQVRASGLPVGWGTVPDCAAPAATCDWWERHGLTDPARGAGHDILFVLLVLAGWALMVIATLPGARFWFDALSRLGTLRSTGPKPATR